jgi:thioredoxin reductase
VFGEDKTAMHYALLHNYLGFPEIGGTEFQQVAREQVAGAGATLLPGAVDAVERSGEGFVVRSGGVATQADYVILAGARPSIGIAEGLGADTGDGAVLVDGDQRTSVAGLYAAGRVVRPHRSQAVISAGQGAAAALDILAREAGKDVTDWDSPPD